VLQSTVCGLSVNQRGTCRLAAADWLASSLICPSSAS